jgi:hypothetical protein
MMLVPFADMINHDSRGRCSASLVNKQLHLAKDENYLYRTDFDTFEYDKT